MNEQKEERKPANPANFRPTLAFFRANAKGTGCALEMNLIPATGADEGCIMASFANQMTVGDRRGAVPVYPHFDWEHKLVVKLGFDDLCEMLQVFRGERETLGEEEKGLYHRTKDFFTKINLRHLVEPTSCYSFELYRTATNGEESHAHMILKPAEALGLCCAIENSLGVICFGVPKEVRNAAAA